ncbi:MAG: SCP2 domain-containing protein [Acidiferrobacterales bacterium]
MIPSVLKSGLSFPLRVLPNSLHSKVLARACNFLMRGQGLESRLREMEGKSLGLRITDIPIDFCFTVRGGRLHQSSVDNWDARISGRLSSFWLLATSAEDPDTLFFDRRLNIEGDTETGLYIKNMLDAIEFNWQAHFADVVGREPPRSLQHLLSRIKIRFDKRVHG